MPLSEQAQAFIDAIANGDRPGWEEMSPAEGREIFNGFDELFGEGPELARVENRVLPGDVKVRIFADSDETQPAVMYFHGGGWVLGNIDTHDALCRRIAKLSGCVIISVDYSRSPEHRYPKAFNECHAATKYVAEHAAEFGIDKKRIAVMGDSAGGNLAAAVALKSRDEGPKLALQVLIYPVIEPVFDTESYQAFGTGHGLSLANMRWFWDQYLGDQQADAFAAPSRAKTLAGLPPAHVITAEFDVLRDESEAYARQLNEAGVPTTTSQYLGNLHGFIHFAGAFDDGLAATQRLADTLKHKFEK
ncbi:MAG: alpha/beta hydrolase [Rubripirellula sp.]